MPRLTSLVLGVALGAAASSAVWHFTASKPRRLSIGHSIAVELTCTEPAAVLVQTRGQGATLAPYGYATLGPGSGADLFLPGELDEAAVTIGVGGTLVDTATGKEFADVQSGTWSAGRTERGLEIRGAAPIAMLQTEQGTLLRGGVGDGVLVTGTTKHEPR